MYEADSPHRITHVHMLATVIVLRNVKYFTLPSAIHTDQSAALPQVFFLISTPLVSHVLCALS